jgi:hypothetical protein
MTARRGPASIFASCLPRLVVVARGGCSSRPQCVKTVADQRLSPSSCDPLFPPDSGFWGTAHEFDKYFRGTNGYKSEVGYTGGDLSLGTPSASP